MPRTPSTAATSQINAFYLLSKLSQGVRILLGLKQNHIRIQPPVKQLRQCCNCSHRQKSSSSSPGRILMNSIDGKKADINVKEMIERGSMVIEGLRQFAAYRSGSLVSTLPKIQLPAPVNFPTLNNTTPSQPESLDIEIESMQSHVETVINVAPEQQREEVMNNPVISTSSHIPIDLKAERHLSSFSKESHVPSSRLARISTFGSLVASLGIGSLAEASKRTFGFSDANGKPVFLSDSNINRIVETLCKVRGAALKLGQIISIQDEAIVSPEIAAAFERVRQSADFMPFKQMYKVMRRELGEDWREKYFTEFSDKPFAAASIGQVHEAVLKDGSNVAVKIQYPGVAEGIESDIKNLMMILKVWNIFPDGVFLDQLMKTARLELGWEVDYEREAQCQIRYSKFISPYRDEMKIRVPTVYPEISTKRIFVSKLINGVPIDRLFKDGNIDGISQEVRNDVAARLLRLTLKEVFEFRFMQTDPNFSNYFYDPETDLIYLLDFGASREYSADFIKTYFNLIQAAANQDYNGIAKFSRDIGFLTGFESKIMEQAHVEAVRILGEAFADAKEFDFGSQSTSKKIAKLIPVMVTHRLTPPPEETYSLHRKMSGIFLLCSKLKAKVNCRQIYLQECERYLDSET